MPLRATFSGSLQTQADITASLTLGSHFQGFFHDHKSCRFTLFLFYECLDSGRPGRQLGRGTAAGSPNSSSIHSQTEISRTFQLNRIGKYVTMHPLTLGFSDYRDLW